MEFIGYYLGIGAIWATFSMFFASYRFWDYWGWILSTLFWPLEVVITGWVLVLISLEEVNIWLSDRRK